MIMTENGHNGNNTDDNVVRAIAKFTFTGKNNDELSFDKNDIILVTQQLDGGWWEGNIDGKIGWFPSDFVAIISNESSESTAHLANTEINSKIIEKDQAKNRKAVILEYTSMEKEHLRILGNIYEEYLRPIRQHDVVSDEEYRILSCNLEEIVKTKAMLLENVVAQAKLDLNQQRIGGAFLNAAPKLKELLTEYCLNHPCAVQLITKNKLKLEEFFQKNNLELKTFIFGLSLVFRHIEKYAVILQEIERNYPDSHPDKGNLQRAGAVYRSIWHDCSYIRKQKEMQLDFLSSNYLEKWYGKGYEKILGELIHIGGVTIGNTRESILGDFVDRKILIFSKMILFLESIMSNDNFDYKRKEFFATKDLIVSKLETNLSLEFKNDKILLITVNSLTNDDYQHLIDALTSCGNITFDDNLILQQISPASPHKLILNDLQSIKDVSPVKKVEVTQLPQSQQPQLRRKNSNNSNNLNNDENNFIPSLSDIKFDHELQMIIPENIDENDSKNIQQQQLLSTRRKGKLYSGYCLRPYPAPRFDITEQSGKIKLRKGMTDEEKDDAYMLRIVEDYCSASMQLSGNKPKSSINALKRTMSYPEEVRPQLIVAEDEKILVEEKDGDMVVYKERTLVDTVYSLKDQVLMLQKELQTVQKNLEKEQKARRRLEESLRRSSQQLSLSSSTPKPNEFEQLQ